MQRDGGPGGGGPGGGGPVGSSNSFTGPADALELVGDHCYAYSGNVVASGADEPDTPAFNFTTGNYYAVMELKALTLFVGNETRHMRTSLNGSAVSTVKADGSPDFYNIFPVVLVVPSYTTVLVEFGVSGGGTFNFVITGRIYRG